MKKKRENLSALEHAKLKIPSDFQSGNAKIHTLIEELRNTDSFELQQQIISELAKYLKSDNCDDNPELILKLLTYLFLTANPKLPIKKTIVRILNNSDSHKIEACLASHLQNFIHNLKTNSQTEILKASNVFCNYCLSCAENYAPGLRALSSVARELFIFVSDYLKQLVSHLTSNEVNTVQIKEEIFAYVHNTTRVLLFLIQKCSVDKYLSGVAVEIVQLCCNILNNKEIAFDTKKNCGLIVVYTFNFLPSEITRDFVYKNNPALELLTCGSNNGNCIQTVGICNYSNDHTVKLALYCGILNVVPKAVLSTEMLDGGPVIAYLFREVICCVKLTTSVPTQILEVSHALTLLSRSLDKVPLATLLPLFIEGLHYVWTHLDHHVDTVRHMTKTVFKNFIQLATTHKQEDINGCLLRMIFDDIDALPFTAVSRYIALYLLASEISCSSLLLNMKLLLPQQMLENIKDPTLAQQICTLYEYLMDKHFIELTPQYEEVWVLQWVKIILPYLKEEQPHTATSYYQRLLIAAFKINPLILRIIMQYQFQSTPAEFGALLGCLRAARKGGIQINFTDCCSHSYWRGLIEEKTLEVNMFHQNDEIRVAVLALVVETQKTTEIFTEWELNFLRKYLYYNITAQIASTRKDVVHFFKKALTRIGESLAVLKRKLRGDPEGVDEAAKSKTLYANFLNHILRECLLPGLLCDANFARRAASLELLLFFHQTFNEKYWKDVWYDDDIFNLMYTVVFDGYESNKQMAVNLLKQFPSINCKLQTSRERTIQDLKNTLALASDLKPSNTIAAAYMFEVCLISPCILDVIQELTETKENSTGNALADLIVFLLKEIESKLNKENSLQVDKTFCTYGIVFCVRHLLEKTNLLENTEFWRDILSNHIINLCFKIHDLVGPIVTNPSPEGHLPEDCEIFDEDDIDESTKAQALLVFAWRNVKEVALLLGDIAARVTACEDKIKLVEDEVLLKIGEFFIDLFVRTKHRGVFEQAYLGFYKLCDGFWRCNNVKLKGLPELWLLKMLDVLSGNANDVSDGLCATRRSAGLPFLILAILATEPISRANKSFHNCIKTLLNTAGDVSQENCEKRTHCMNVLRAIYRHNQLGELVSQYVGRGMIAAITGLKSTIWGVRNAATLLFAALVTRIFGVQRTRNHDSLSTKNKMTVKVFFMRYPELHQFLLKELADGCEDSGSLTLYPVLLILSRLYPSNFGGSDVNLKDDYLPLVTKCLSHTIYRTRELAAQAAVPFISQSHYLQHVVKLLLLLSNVKLCNNELHGLLLQLLHLVKQNRERSLNVDLARLCLPTFWILLCVGKQVSYLNAALYMEVLVLLISLAKEKVMDQQIFQTLLDIIEWQLKSDLHHFKDYTVNLHYLKLYLLARMVESHNFLALYTANEILQNLRNANMCVRAFYLNIILCLNFERPNYSKHSLYVSDDLEIPEKEHTVVQAFHKDFRKQWRKHLHIHLKDVFVLDDFLKNSECRLPALLVLRYYPCVISALCPSDNVIDYLLNLPNCDSEECVSAVIDCVSSVVRKLKSDVLIRLNCDALVEFLVDSCCPTAALHRRLAVCDFLLDNRSLFCGNEIFNTKTLCDIWNVIMVLLEDDDPLVRNSISRLNTRTETTTRILAKVGLDIISERAREELLMKCMTTLPFKDAVNFLVKWSLRYKPDYIDNTLSVVFTRGYHNLYAETTPVVKVTVKLLKELLWSLEEGLNYEDKSIFIEEKALMVSNVLVNAVNAAAPVMSDNMHEALLAILKAVVEFLEVYPINKATFKAHFKKMMTREQMNCSLVKSLNKNDFNSLRLFFWTIYSPILNS